MICVKCGREIADDSKFCTFCGARVELQPAAELKEPEAAQEPVAPEAVESFEAPEAAEVAQEPPASEAAESPEAAQEPPTATPEPSAPQEQPALTEPASGAAPSPVSTPTPVPIPPQAVPFPVPPAPSPGFAPGFTQPGAPQGFCPPGAPQGIPPQGAPVYPVPAPTIQPPQQPQKKKTGIIIAIVVTVVLLCCVAVSTAVFLYLVPLGPPVASSTSDSVLVDDKNLTIIIDAGSGKMESIFGAYVVNCTVENKTTARLGIYFESDTSINGVDADTLNTIIFPKNGDGFLPGETVDGGIMFLTVPTNGQVTNLKGTLVVYDTKTLKTLGEYPVSIARL